MDLLELADKLRMGSCPIVPAVAAQRLGDELRELVHAAEDANAEKVAGELRNCIRYSEFAQADGLTLEGAAAIVMAKANLWGELLHDTAISGPDGIPEEKVVGAIKEALDDIAEVRAILTDFGALAPDDTATGTLDLLRALLPGREP